MVWGVRLARPRVLRMPSSSSAGRKAASALPTLVECRSMRRPTQVFILMKPGASTFSM